MPLPTSHQEVDVLVESQSTSSCAPKSGIIAAKTVLKNEINQLNCLKGKEFITNLNFQVSKLITVWILEYSFNLMSDLLSLHIIENSLILTLQIRGRENLHCQLVVHPFLLSNRATEILCATSSNKWCPVCL